MQPDLYYMLLLCTKNGALVREKYKKLFAEDNWDRFNEIISESAPGNDLNCGIFLEYPEICPNIKFENLSVNLKANGEKVKLFEKPTNILRALIECKILSLKINAKA